MAEIREETPQNIEELKRAASDKTNYRDRLSAVEVLGGYKCQQSKDILWRLMMNDKLFAVQEAAFRKLQAFGEEVKLPKKKKGHLIKDINKKLEKMRSSLGSEFTIEQFKERFKDQYPEEFDVYSYEKQSKFDAWLSNVLGSLPKR